MALATSVDVSLCKDVLAGLARRRKVFPSRQCHYFYDGEGSRLFEEITEQPTYYLTRCEESIFAEDGPGILRSICGGRPLRLVELGVGDGHKSIALLKACAGWLECEYVPTDICTEMVDRVCARIADELAQTAITVSGMAGEHFAVIDRLLAEPRETRTAAMFLGSNIGNYSAPAAERFLRHLRGALVPGDVLVLGLDQKPHAGKPVAVVEGAYRDDVTKQFTLNLLARMNAELGADFELASFAHHACYRHGRIETCLVSLRQQAVSVAGRMIEFAPGEEYFVERSQKFNRFDVESMAAACGFSVVRHYPCRRDWYLISVLRAA